MQGKEGIDVRNVKTENWWKWKYFEFGKSSEWRIRKFFHQLDHCSDRRKIFWTIKNQGAASVAKCEQDVIAYLWRWIYFHYLRILEVRANPHLNLKVDRRSAYLSSARVDEWRVVQFESPIVGIHYYRWPSISEKHIENRVFLESRVLNF